MARPRQAENYAGSALGVISGAILGGVPGAVLGGLLGTAANRSVSLPLDQALALYLQPYGLTLVNAIRVAKNSLQFLFTRDQTNYWSLTVTVRLNSRWTPDQLDDALYDAAIEELESWVASHAPR